MLVFPNCKINLGLNVVEKRPDGFHNIETVFYPIHWCDALEVLENKSGSGNFEYSQSGLSIEGSLETNLIYKAWQYLGEIRKIPPLKVHLHKNIPMGAGLGGGSSDAAAFINLLDTKFNLMLSPDEKYNIANKLGSDCAFFINSKPVYASDKGNVFADIKLDLSKYYILLVYPGVHSNTAKAYAGLNPVKKQQDLKKVIETNAPSTWKNLVINDFEKSIFHEFPKIESLKQQLYDQGALYASMSGSGSAVFGIFEKEPVLNFSPSYRYYLQKP